MGKVLSFYKAFFKRIGAIVIIENAEPDGATLSIDYRGMPFEVVVSETNHRAFIMRATMFFRNVGDEAIGHIARCINQANHQAFGAKYYLMDTDVSTGVPIDIAVVCIESVLPKTEDLTDLFDTFAGLIANGYQRLEKMISA